MEDIGEGEPMGAGTDEGTDESGLKRLGKKDSGIVEREVQR
jgi:hypothetical protein